MPVGFWLIVAAFMAFAAWMIVPIEMDNRRRRADYAARRAEWEAATARGECPPPINTLR